MKMLFKTRAILLFVFFIAATGCCFEIYSVRIEDKNFIAVQGNAKSGYIKWVNFNVPYSAMDKAMKLDIRSHSSAIHISWRHPVIPCHSIRRQLEPIPGP